MDNDARKMITERIEPPQPVIHGERQHGQGMPVAFVKRRTRPAERVPVESGNVLVIDDIGIIVQSHKPVAINGQKQKQRRQRRKYSPPEEHRQFIRWANGLTMMSKPRTTESVRAATGCGLSAPP